MNHQLLQPAGRRGEDAATTSKSPSRRREGRGIGTRARLTSDIAALHNEEQGVCHDEATAWNRVNAR